MIKDVAVFDSDGYFAGIDSDYGGPLPHSSTYVIPDLLEGFIPRWDSEGWHQVENHKDRQGYISASPATINAYGPLPAGWSDEYVDPRSPEEIRIAEIDIELRKFDRDAERPLCSILSGLGTDDDKATLTAIEAMKIELREERKTLAGIVQVAKAKEGGNDEE